jgi:hypothetical protein
VSTDRASLRETMLRHGGIVLVLLEVLLILVYYRAEVEPFVYIHF